MGYGDGEICKFNELAPMTSAQIFVADSKHAIT